MMIITSSRLTLRQFKPEDSTALMSVFGDKDVMHHGNGIQTIEWVEHWILRQQNSYQKFDYGNWAIILKQTNEFIGYCGLNYIEDLDGKTEISIGYRLAKEYWGKGYATEAVTATLKYSFETLGLKRIVATIDPNNVASIHVAKNAGMVCEKEVMLEGYAYPDYLYVIEAPTKL